MWFTDVSIGLGFLVFRLRVSGLDVGFVVEDFGWFRV